jgi:hypothetical protein
MQPKILAYHLVSVVIVVDTLYDIPLLMNFQINKPSRSGEQRSVMDTPGMREFSLWPGADLISPGDRTLQKLGPWTPLKTMTCDAFRRCQA